MQLTNVIQRSLGLSDKEASTYLALLQSGSSTVKPIADKTGIKRTSIYNFIDDLVAKGLVTKAVVRGRRYYQAVPPDKLVDIARSQVAEIEQHLPLLMSLLKSSVRKMRVQYFEGPSEVRNIVKEEIRCKKLARYIWPGVETLEMIGGAKYMERIDQERLRKGVHIRTIRFLQKDKPFSTSAHGEKYKRAIRFAPPSFDISIAMGIYDTGKVSFFSSKKEGFGLLIESEELVRLMGAFYELLWNNCIPAKEGQG